jgi:ferredoxin-type protein NapG
MPDDRRVNRRRFFQESLRELLRPLSETLEKAANDLAAMEPEPKKVVLPILRPPGALPGNAYLETCSRCTACVRVCPAQCIKIDTTGKRGDGAPYIDADTAACLVCTGLYCMPACPSGALQITALNDIHMGTAAWNSESCVRTSGEDCSICVDHCPLGTFAIELINGNVVVHEKGCIGCGVCQHDCPTTPKSITVIPAT